VSDSTLALPLQIGEEITLEATTRFELNEESTIWLIEKEMGDLFFYDPQDPHFLPIFIQHCEEGSIIIGASTSADPKYRLFFLSPRRTTLRKISFSALYAEIVKTPALKDTIIKIIERYLHQLFLHFPTREAQIQKILDYGKSIDLASEEIGAPRRSYIPEEKEHLAWIELLKGSCDFQGEVSSSYIKETGVYYPMTQTHWLKSQEESTLRAFTTSEALGKKEFWKGINILYHEMFKKILMHKNETLERTLLLLQKRHSLEEDLVEQTLLNLGSVLNDEITIPHLHRGDSLFQACDLIGQKIGLKFNSIPTIGKSVDAKVNELCSNSNIHFRRVALKKEWWKEAVEPLLGFLGPELKPVALFPYQEGKYELFDPVEKKKKHLSESLAEQLNENAYVFYKGFPEGSLTFFQVAKRAFRGSLKPAIWLLFLAAVIGSLNLFLPFATTQLFDVILFGTNISLFKQFLAGLILVSISTTIFTLCKNYAVLRINGLSKSGMQEALWLRVLDLPVSFFRKFNSGDLATRIMAFEKIRMEATSNFINLCVSAIFCFYYLLMLFVYDSLFAFVGLIGLFVAALIFVVCINVEIRLTERSFNLGTKLQGIVVQIIGGIAKIRTAGAEGRFFNLWGDVFTQKKKIDLKLQLVTAIERLVYRILPLVMSTLLFWIAIVSFQKNPKIALSVDPSQSMGTFVGFYTAYALLIAATLDVFQMAFSIWSVLPYWKSAKLITQEEKEVSENKSQSILLKGAVSLEHLSFSYTEGGPLALDNISIHANPGEMIAIVGPSGCGKSTIVRFLLGFEKAQQGKVSYDENDISECDVRMIRKQIGTVLQNESMIAGSIYDIIAGTRILSPEAVVKAIRLAGLEEDFKRFPMGLNTVMSMGGNTISGGQRQRLFLARALASSPKILILDEATSALDNTAQSIIEHNLENLDITRIVIAHRLITTRNADRIYVMNEGKIIQVGTYDELSKRPGLFSEMLKRQQL